MAQCLTYIIDDIPPSNNKYMGNSHNFNEYRRTKEYWHWLVKSAIKSKPPKPLEKAVVHIKYYFPDRRRRDLDNYSPKMLLDPLVRGKVLIDDSWQHVVKLVITGNMDKERPRTEIEVIELE